uniref:Uncharacterized protein n=1 Tax=Arion vulgaris TaxID=1028688 RepID=A0A0B6ZIK1_9EUPU
MKLTDVVSATRPVKKFTNYQNLGYKYKVVRIPALKDEVKSRRPSPEGAHCVNEMTTMMDCWKRTDFNSAACGLEVENFNKCVALAQAAATEARQHFEKGLPVKGSRMLPSRVVNEMLAQYPQPESNLK